MDKRYRVRGLFILEVEAEDSWEASGKAERIMRDRGIEGHVIKVEEVRRDKKGDCNV